MAWLLKITLDAAIGGSMDKLINATIIVLIYMSVYSLISWLTRVNKASYLREIMFFIKQDFMESILNFNIREFIKKGNSEYISIFNNDLKMIETNYFSPIFLIVRNIVILVISLFMMLYINPIISLIAIILSFLPMLVPKVYGKVLSKVTELYSDDLKKYNRKIDDIFNGFEIIKSFSVENYIRESHSNENYIVEKSKEKTNIKRANADVFTNFIAVGMQFAVFLVSGLFVIRGELTAGDVIAITQLMTKVVNPIFDIVDEVNSIKSVDSIGKNIIDIIDSEKKNASNYAPLEINNKIKLKDVSFNYSKDEIGVKNISLKLEKGKKYAIVGESGSGKTTLIKLILGYFDDYSGDIFIDNVDKHSIVQERIFKAIATMNQSVFVFEDTILQNIVLHKDYDSKKLNSIIEKIGLDKTLLRKGVDLDYKLSRNGENLSGGEKQKIALARALIRGRDWIVLDEATSNLDNKTLWMIEDLLVNLADVTCITVTHRYTKEILEKYDKIFVMNRGELVEEGTFDELMEKKNLFYSLYNIGMYEEIN